MSGQNGPPPSPTSLAPTANPPTVRRLGRLPLYLAGGVGLIVVAVGSYYAATRMLAPKPTTQDTAKDTVRKPGDPKSMLDSAFARWRSTEDKATTATASPDKASDKVTGQTTGQSQQTTAQAKPDVLERAREQAWDTYFAQLAELQKTRHDSARAAMLADTAVAQKPRSVAPGAVPGTATASAEASFGAGQGYGVPAIAGLPGALGGVDPSGQSGKLAFMNKPGDPLGMNEDLQAVQHGPKPNTIMQGTPIPAVMMGGATSDMPGQVRAQVTENVYDTQTGGRATGGRPLIPQFATLIGQYDTAVSGGQTRMGFIWNRIIMPDTSSIQIGSMTGADQGGYAGFADQVKTHFWDKVGAASLIAFAGAGAQLAQPQQSAFSGYSPASVATGALTQQFSQIGQEYARAGLAIPNTILIRPGYRFVVLVNKDIALQPYVDQRDR